MEVSEEVRYTLGQSHARQACASRERPGPKIGQIVPEPHARESSATFERRPIDVSHAVWKRDAGQANEMKERSAPNAGNGQPINRAGDDHVAARTGIPRDGDGAAIVIGPRLVLGLRRGG